MQEDFTCLKTKVLFASDFASLAHIIGELGNDTLWVCDSNTARMVRPLPAPNVIIEPGETSKSLANAERILKTAAEAKLTKSSVFIALGGGVVCDLTKFAASIYMRGCSLVFVPTTLLAMADASIGGNSGINYMSTKNLIGSVYPADSVIICPDLLKTLSDYEFTNGLAEIIKHAVISENKELFKILISKNNKIVERDKDVVTSIIRESLLAKKTFLENDNILPLKLGHEFAHAFEGMKHLSCPEGQALAWGVCKAVEISAAKGICTQQYAQSIIMLFNLYGYKTDFKISRSDWIEFRDIITRNKRNLGDKVKYVLIQEDGKCVLDTVEDDLLKKIIIVGAES